MPAGLTQEQQKKCAELARSGSLSGAIDLLKNEVHMTPKDAKTAVSHVSKNGQICHWCQKALGSAGQIECGECRSLNFAW
jgi:hypothetical protein